jgi:hypothetical protein
VVYRPSNVRLIDSELESIAVALEWIKSPSAAVSIGTKLSIDVASVPIETIPPGKSVFNSNRRGEFTKSVSSCGHIRIRGNGQKIQTIVHIVPKPCASKKVAFARTLFAGEPIRALTILPWVPVHVRIQIEDCIVR